MKQGPVRLQNEYERKPLTPDPSNYNYNQKSTISNIK